VLTKGQPNVSYICSRYYRAPELLFGATEYTCAAGPPRGTRATPGHAEDARPIGGREAVPAPPAPPAARLPRPLGLPRASAAGGVHPPLAPSQVDLWSVGTILAELLLGHLPFQGQDSTQQHLVEIMKLLGTPTERELRAMRATCTTADLPKLKTYPWERQLAGNAVCPA
jgi:serine/threonine protein kinase